MKKYFAVLMAVLFSFLCLMGCEKQDLGEVTVQNVGVITGIGSVGIVDRFAGVVVSESETKVEKSDTAEIKDILVQVGDTVQEGQTLFTYDSTMMEFTLEQAKLDLERKKLTLESQIQDKEKLEEEKEKAKEDQQLAFMLEIREMEANIQESEYNIKLKEQEIEKLEAGLLETSVESPISGRIQAINQNGGYDDYGRPLPFMTIVEDGTYRVQGYINETNAQALPEGTPVLLRSRVTKDTWSGVVTKIDWENAQSGQGGMVYYEDSGPGTASSSKYPFYVELFDSEGLMLGQHVYIEPDYGQDVIDEANRMMLPAYFIVDPDTDPFVWAMDGKEKLEKRKVTLGEQDEMMGTYEIVSGLSADDYIAFPDETLVEGMKCTVYDPSQDMPIDNGGAVVPVGPGDEIDNDGDMNFDNGMNFEDDMNFDGEFNPENGYEIEIDPDAEYFEDQAVPEDGAGIGEPLPQPGAAEEPIRK